MNPEFRERILHPLSRKGNSRYNWDAFNPELYHSHNYEEIESFDNEVLEKMVAFYKKEKPSGLFLEVGAGSNMYPILAALPYAEQIDVWEFGKKNVAYLQRQTEELDPSWQKWTDKLRALDPETYGNIDFQQQLQQKMRVTQGSIFDLPLETYDNCSMHSVAESLTKKRREFKKAVRSFVSAGKPKSTIVASFMENSVGYNTPGREFPALPIEAWNAVKIFGGSMSSLSFESTKEEIRPGSPLIIVKGRKK